MANQIRVDVLGLKRNLVLKTTQEQYQDEVRQFNTEVKNKVFEGAKLHLILDKLSKWVQANDVFYDDIVIQQNDGTWIASVYYR